MIDAPSEADYRAMAEADDGADLSDFDDQDDDYDPTDPNHWRSFW